MDIFGDFNGRSLDDMMKDINEKLKKFGFEPMYFGTDFTSESRIDVNGEWTKSTYTSEDGKTKIVTMTRGFDGPEKKNSVTKSNDLKFLERELQRAVDDQNFELAVELRDRIAKVKNSVEVIKDLETKLEDAISKQNFELCIELRNKINELKS